MFLCLSSTLLSVGTDNFCREPFLSNTRIWHWKFRVMLKIERTKDMSNAEKFQWDYKGFEHSWITIKDQFQCDKRDNFSIIIFYKAFQCGFRDISLWCSVSYSHSVGTVISFGFGVWELYAQYRWCKHTMYCLYLKGGSITFRILL